MIDKCRKKIFLLEWIVAWNQHGGFGEWAMFISRTKKIEYVKNTFKEVMYVNPRLQ
jgi:hypothetical protein